MTISHRFGLRADKKQRDCLTAIGVNYKRVDDDLLIIVVDENSPHWLEVSRLMTEWKVRGLPSTTFSKSELANARFLVMRPAWHLGYPKPDDGFAYLSITYDDREHCRECGVGLKQQAPFRMSGEPKWGSNQILQLNWVFDEYFVTPDSWEKVFRPLGIDCLPVMKHKTGRPLETVVQLKIVTRTTPLTDFSNYVSNTCQICNRSKLGDGIRGRFPHVTLPDDEHLSKTAEYFGGDGSAAWHEVVASARLYNAITEAKLKGVVWRVVADQGRSLF